MAWTSSGDAHSFMPQTNLNPKALLTVRNQVAMSLPRVQELENQVQVIPNLRDTISQLMEKLKEKEAMISVLERRLHYTQRQSNLTLSHGESGDGRATMTTVKVSFQESGRLSCPTCCTILDVQMNTLQKPQPLFPLRNVGFHLYREDTPLLFCGTYREDSPPKTIQQATNSLDLSMNNFIREMERHIEKHAMKKRLDYDLDRWEEFKCNCRQQDWFSILHLIRVINPELLPLPSPPNIPDLSMSNYQTTDKRDCATSIDPIMLCSTETRTRVTRLPNDDTSKTILPGSISNMNNQKSKINFTNIGRLAINQPTVHPLIGQGHRYRVTNCRFSQVPSILRDVCSCTNSHVSEDLQVAHMTNCYTLYMIPAILLIHGKQRCSYALQESLFHRQCFSKQLKRISEPDYECDTEPRLQSSSPTISVVFNHVTLSDTPNDTFRLQTLHSSSEPLAQGSVHRLTEFSVSRCFGMTKHNRSMTHSVTETTQELVVSEVEEIFSPSVDSGSENHITQPSTLDGGHLGTKTIPSYDSSMTLKTWSQIHPCGNKMETGSSQARLLAIDACNATQHRTRKTRQSKLSFSSLAARAFLQASSTRNRQSTLQLNDFEGVVEQRKKATVGNSTECSSKSMRDELITSAPNLTILPIQTQDEAENAKLHPRHQRCGTYAQSMRLIASCGFMKSRNTAQLRTATTTTTTTTNTINAANTTTTSTMMTTSTSTDSQPNVFEPIEAGHESTSESVVDMADSYESTSLSELSTSNLCTWSDVRSSRSRNRPVQHTAMDSSSSVVMTADQLNTIRSNLSKSSEDVTVVAGDEEMESMICDSQIGLISAAFLAACQTFTAWLEDSTNISSKSMNSASATVRRCWFEVAAGPDAHHEQVEAHIKALQSVPACPIDRVVNMVDQKGNTALHYAVSHSRWLVVDALLTNCPNIDVDKCNRAGFTASMLAAAVQDTPVMRNEEVAFNSLLSRADLSLTSNNPQRQTVLMLAAIHGRTRLVLRLIEVYGVPINQKDAEGSTALMAAAEHNRAEVVRILLSTTDADAELRDNDGSTALDIALARKHHEIALMIYAKVKMRKLNPRPLILSRLFAIEELLSHKTATGFGKLTNESLSQLMHQARTCRLRWKCNLHSTDRSQDSTTNQYARLHLFNRCLLYVIG